jgi:hypothetical protein
MAIKLLQTHNIMFTRHGNASDKNYIDEYGDVIASTTVSYIETQGSLQPFSKKQNRVGLAEGFREEDYLVYYTQSDLRAMEQFENLQPDTCTINGKQFKVTRKGDWSGFGLKVDNYEYYLQLIQPQGS